MPFREEALMRFRSPRQRNASFKSERRNITLPYFQVVRAKMVLLAAQGLSNDEIAASLGTRREVVSLWRKHFFEEHLAGLEERPRPGDFPPRSGHSGQSSRV